MVKRHKMLIVIKQNNFLWVFLYIQGTLIKFYAIGNGFTSWSRAINHLTNSNLI